MIASVEPESTDRAVVVVPVAVAIWSTAAVPMAVDRPEYSSAAMPMSALADGLAMIVGLVPPLAVIGAVQTVRLVPSEAVVEATSVNVSHGRVSDAGDRGFTGTPVGHLHHEPVSGRDVSRHRDRDAGLARPVRGYLLDERRRDRCRRRDGLRLREGQPGPDRIGGGNGEGVRVTVGQPGHVGRRRRRTAGHGTVADCATPARYGVTVYMVIGLPPLAGADQLTVADWLPAVAATFVGTAGAVGTVGSTWLDGGEASPVPTPLVAETWKV